MGLGQHWLGPTKKSKHVIVCSRAGDGPVMHLYDLFSHGVFVSGKLWCVRSGMRDVLRKQLHYLRVQHEIMWPTWQGAREDYITCFIKVVL